MGPHRIICMCAWITVFVCSGSATSIGTEFITTFMQNSLSDLSQQRYELRITAHSDNTSVKVTVLGGAYSRNFSMNGERSISVALPSSSEIRGSMVFNNTVVISSDKPINIQSLNHKFRTGETSIVYPVASLGNEYYIITPKDGPSGNYKVFSVLAYKEATSVEIMLKGTVEFRGQKYPANKPLSINLAPFQGIELLSQEDLSGTHVKSQKPVAVLSGHTCAWKNTKCNHVYEQLLPVSQWGTSFFVAPLSIQPNADRIYVIAAGPTKLTYTLGTDESKSDMVAGQVLEIQISRLPLRITASAGVQVTYFNTGGRSRRYEFNPLLMNIMDTKSFCSSYYIYGQRDVDNYAILIATNSTTDGITIDKSPLRNPSWNAIPGTEYYWFEYYIGNSFTSHVISHPDKSFGLQSIGTGALFSYGSPGSCVKESGPPPPSCSTVTCPRRQVCIMENEQPKCIAQQFAVCQASGDPHYITFDNRYYDFMGTCTYTFVSTCGNIAEDLPQFTVLTKNDNRGNVLVSWVAQVTFQTSNYSIDVMKHEVGTVRVNNHLSGLPVTLMNGVLVIFQSGNTLVIQLGNDVQVSYDWNHVVRVELTKRYEKSVCGLCGNYNQNPQDDFQPSNGPQTTDVVAFGGSWSVGNETNCWHDCRGPCASCPPDVAQKYRTDNYCGLISKSDGPFIACHKTIDPQIYMENCVYDVCFNYGSKKISCDTLKTYADACQRAGVNISQWREAAGCPFSCPANSLYKLCGRPCSATCQDLDASSQCTEPCIETCECNPGFVLIKGQCQPRESCGCVYQGLTYASNQTFWGDDICQQKCVCNGQTQKVECSKSPCRAAEECAVKNGLRDCYPVKFSTCTASGNPHFITYDSVRYDFQGTCQYQLSALSDHKSDLTDFQVYTLNQNRGSARASFVSRVTAKVYGQEIEISKENTNKVKVDGVFINLPYSSAEGRLSLFRNPNSIVIRTDFDVTVAYDMLSSIVRVTLPSTYSGKVSGLCGNFNGKQSDEFIYKNEKTPTSAVAFAQKWNVTNCKVAPEPECPQLAELERRQREQATDCGVILSPTGPFRDCHSLVNPEDYFKNCVYDYCVLDQRQTIFCAELSSYVQACQAAGAIVHPWRSEEFCSYSCPANSHYELCANGCPFTCNGFTSPAGCDSSCREGCVCDDGFVLSGATCVRLSSCGCTDNNGVYYSVGESYYVGDKCDERCTCNEGGHLSCSSTTCLTSEECRIEKGVHGCFPVGSATCTAFSDPHYRTFDGKAYSHQGLCSYVLSQTCADTDYEPARNLTEFKVTIQNEKFGSDGAAVRLVTLEVYGQRLALRRNKQGVVEVNEVDFHLPLTLLSGKVRVESHGFGGLIETDFGLKVTYNLRYHVAVTVPSNYKNRTCGMCGNYNGNAEDDANDIVALGKIWEVPGKVGDCGNPDNTPCEDRKIAIFSQENYCGILSDPTGPFAKCHALVNPAPFQSDCIFDLCQSNGDRSILCDNAVSYAAACMNAGVTDIQWRTEEFCGIQCPLHSHYTTCANLCTSSCADLTDPHGCSDQCAEGCDCDDGYMFDGTKCIPLQQCGCFDNGRYYKANETLLLDNCGRECTCNPYSGLICRNNSCAADETCQILDGVMSCINIDPCKSKTCRVKETCDVRDGRAVCVPDYTGTCWAWGDPHFHNFDGYNFDFQGTCTYVLATYTGTDTSLVPFRFEIKNDNRGSQAFSFVRMVNMVIYGFKITIQTGEYGKIRVNDILTNLPVTLAEGAIRIYQAGFEAVVDCDFGLTASFDWNWHAIIIIPSSYYNSVSGLCGNFNENPNDDQRSPNNTEISNIAEWAGSWKVYDRDPFCFDECPGECPSCEESKKKQFSGDQYCGLIFKENGPFRECHSKVNPNNFFDSCLFDVCMNNGAKNILCPAIESYVSTCMKQGVKIYDWRTPTQCAKACGENSHYEACGSACPATCSDRNATRQCTKPCVETCQCDENFVLSVDKCVPISSCGCQYNGQYYLPNQEFWSDNKCKVHCKCNPSLGMVVCEKNSCKTSETCMVANGVLGCYPTEYSTCIASGDPHLTTFDGNRYDFMGTCIYQMVGVATNDSTLTNFTVNVQNDNRGNRAVSFTKDVILNVYNQTITMSKDFPQKIKVNGIFTDLPYYYETSKIIAYITGAHVLTKTDFDVTVTFDGYSHARVILPSTYRGAVNGLCGNNNKNPSDDFTFENGTTVQTANDFGEYWKVGEVPGCTICNNCPTPTCTSEQNTLYIGDQFCGVITRADGPLALCHPVVDPKPYFDDCVYDACQYLGHQSTLCSSIAAYVSECQRLGVKINEWRTPTFCPLTCPKNSHYELCGNGCPTTCYGLSAPRSCVTSCTEGCYCDDGFLLSGKICVPIGQCGCAFRDKYYKQEEEFYMDDQCKQKCKCGNNGETTCLDTTCGDNEECKVVQGILGCHATEFGNCVAWGDAHYTSLDGHVYDFQGSCKYTLVLVNSESANFSVEAEHESFGNVAVTKSLTVHVGNNVFHLDRESRWSTLVNNERFNLPYETTDGQVRVNREGNNIILQTQFGLEISFDQANFVSIGVASSFSRMTQGLCGNFNKNMSDDFHLPDGSITTDPATFGAFWAVSSDGTDCKGCTVGTCLVCDPRQEAEAKSPKSCGLIADPQGPFRDCHALVAPEVYVTKCVYDMCAGGQGALCMSLQAYAVMCQNAGANIENWRTVSNCPLSCPANSHYELCTRTCDVTCAGIFGSSTCTEKCFEGCECDPGYVFDGDKCVRLDSCGCNFNGRYLMANESVVFEDCSQQCTCQSGIVFCETLNCTINEICQIRAGQRGCYPRDSECSINCNHHFTTFDGISGAFPAVGTYVLASSCNASSERQFRVAVDVRQCSKDGTKQKSLHVFTPYGLITKNGGWEFWLNGLELPHSIILGNGVVQFNVTETDATIEIADLIKVVIDKEGDVTVIAYKNVAGDVCGACGNFNGDSSDDLRLKNGDPASSLTHTIRSWTARYFSTCLE